MAAIAAEAFAYDTSYGYSSDQLKNELLEFNADASTTHERVNGSISLITAIKQAKEAKSLIDLDSARKAIMEELLTDGVEYLGSTALFVMEGRGTPGWHSDESEPHLLNAIEARNRMLNGIGHFSRLFHDAPDDKKYDALLATMMDAKRIVSGVDELSDVHTEDIEAHLRGVLAEFKIFEALHDLGYTEAFYTSPEEDLNGKVDIAIPVTGQSKPVQIQVKGQKSADKLMASFKKNLNTVLVKVPMGKDHNPFSIRETDKKRLARQINKSIALNNGEASEVQLAA